MRKLYENFHIFHFQKTIVSAENFHENMVCGCISQLIIVPGSMYCLHYAKFFFNFCWTDETFTILLIRDMVVERWNRRFSCETIHSTQKFTSMNLLQMAFVIIQGQLQRWTEHSTLIFENLKPVEISKIVFKYYFVSA